MQGLTLVMVIRAVEELFLMNDPLITNYSQPLTPEEKSKLVPLNFDDYGYVLAFKLIFKDKTTGEKKPFMELPQEIGAMKASIYDFYSLQTLR